MWVQKMFPFSTICGIVLVCVLVFIMNSLCCHLSRSPQRGKSEPRCLFSPVKPPLSPPKQQVGGELDTEPTLSSAKAKEAQIEALRWLSFIILSFYPHFLCLNVPLWFSFLNMLTLHSYVLFFILLVKKKKKMPNGFHRVSYCCAFSPCSFSILWVISYGLVRPHLFNPTGNTLNTVHS